MSGPRVFIVGTEVDALADALQRRGFDVETVADPAAVDALDGAVAGVALDGETEVNAERLAGRIERALTVPEWATTTDGESLYRTIVEQSHDAIFVAQDGDFEFWNHRLTELTGREADELADTAVLDVVHPDDREMVSEISDARRRGDDAPQSYDVRVVDTDGDTRVCSVNVQHIEYRGGYGVLVTMRDTTERRGYESRLQRYETMVESIQQGAYVVDDERVFQYVNEAAANRLPFPGDALVGEHVSVLRERGLLDDAQYARIEGVLDDVLAGESAGERFELTVSLPAGESVAEFDVTPIVDDAGDVTGAVGLSSDVTERKRHEERLNALHASTRRLSAATSDEEVSEVVCDAAVDVLDYDLCGVFLYDEDLDALVPTTFTEAAEAVFGEIPALPRRTGLSWEVFESNDVHLYSDVEHDARRYDPETDIVEELIVPIPDYGVFFVGALSAGTLADQRVALAKVLASNARAALDRVERERLLRRREAELARQNEQLDSFASAVSHDLKNPLNVATGYLELAREDSDTAALERVARAHDRMAAIVEDVLALARNGQTVEDVERVSLESVATAAWETAATDAPDARLEVHGEVTLEAHEGRLRQLLENLVSNAIRHGGDDVTVEIGPLDDAGFYVADDGPGIPPADRTQVFEAGYTTSEDGTGFGLNVVESVAAAHGWDVSVAESDAGGARFEIRTDVDSAAARTSPAE